MILGDSFDSPLNNSLDKLVNLQQLTFRSGFNQPLNNSLNKCIYVHPFDNIVGATDIMTGENVGQNTPAETARTMTEQGTKVFAGIFKRIHKSLKEEFRKQYRLNQLYLPEEYKYATGAVLANDYVMKADMLRPAADPHVVSDSQRIMQAQTLLQTATSVPGFNMYKVLVRYLDAMKITNIDEVLPDPQGPNAVPPPVNPKVQVEQIKAQTKQADSQSKMKVALGKLALEAELNRAKVVKLEAEALKAIEEAGGVKEGHQIALLEAQIGAAKAHQEGILRSLELMKETMGESDGDSNNETGVPRMDNQPGNQGIVQGPPQR